MTKDNKAEGVAVSAPETQWQPIETAPKDGTGFFYFQKLPFGQQWIGSAVYHDGKCLHVQWNGDECDWTTICPTHWMPLPTPPPHKGTVR